MSIPHLFADIKDLHNRMFNALLLINRVTNINTPQEWKISSWCGTRVATSPPSTQVYNGLLLRSISYLIRQSFLFGLKRSYSKIHTLFCYVPTRLRSRKVLYFQFVLGGLMWSLSYWYLPHCWGWWLQDRNKEWVTSGKRQRARWVMLYGFVLGLCIPCIS